MFIVIIGKVGTGKTLLLTFLAINEGLPIVSNYKFLKRPYEEFDFHKFAQGKYDNCLLALDEIYTIIDSRNSMSKGNRLAGTNVFQSRKVQTQIFGTAQLLSTLDLRYRELTDKIIVAEGLQEHVDYRGQKSYYWLYTIYESGKAPVLLKLDYAQMKCYYDEYNTYQIIEPIDKEKALANLKTEKEQLEDIYRLGNELYKLSQNERVLKSDVILFLKEQGMPQSYKELVWAQYRKLVRNAKDE